MSITILGGGPAGLATGYFARKLGLPFCILEAAGCVGGNAITFREGEFRFDSGAHRFHDKDPEMTAEVRLLLGDDLLECFIPSLIFHQGRSINFPLAPLNLLASLGGRTCLKAACSLVRARLGGAGVDGSYESLATRAYGRELAGRFLLSYSEKLWGVPCHRLSPVVSGKRLRGLNLSTLWREAIGSRQTRARHLDGSFLYPRYGFGMIAEKLAETCGPENIRLAARVTRILHESRRIRAVEVNGSERLVVDEVVNTLPLPVLLQLMEPSLPPGLLRAAQSLRFRHVLLIGLFLNRPRVTTAGSVYFPDPDFPVTRVYEPKNRSADMAPADKTMLVAELPCDPQDAVWRWPDRDLIGLVKDKLIAIGWFRAEDIMGGCVKRLFAAYPVLELGAEDKVGAIVEFLGAFPNLHLVGRNGLFHYGHLHDMLRAGKELVTRLHSRPDRAPAAPPATRLGPDAPS